MFNFLEKTDLLVNNFFLNWSNPTAVKISSIFDIIFEVNVAVMFSVVIVAIFLILAKWKYFWLYIFTVGGGAIFGYILKVLVDRARPDGGLFVFDNFSFPSGHALISTLVLGFFLYILAKSKSKSGFKPLAYILLVLGILATATSRLVLGAHWLSDVVGGILIGVTWLLVWIIIFSDFKFKKVAKVEKLEN